MKTSKEIPKNLFKYLGKYANLPFFQELEEKINITLISVQLIWSYSLRMVSLT